MMLAFLYLTVVSMIYLLSYGGRLAIHRFIIWLLSYRRTYGMYTANLLVWNGLIIYSWSVVDSTTICKLVDLISALHQSD